GGNALQWDWEKAYGFGKQHPFILAGGLAPENICRAVTESAPDAVDVSSGVESCPGTKDSGKVKSFIEALSRCFDKIDRKNIRRIF
ncbi:MAG: phosphoribosylanthranilate isomerase, partial [Desulfobacterales bacterium]|nr:phosphoribosylanthranilate isomerase [Desulfobacterales bacterium]